MNFYVIFTLRERSISSEGNIWAAIVKVIFAANFLVSFLKVFILSSTWRRSVFNCSASDGCAAFIDSTAISAFHSCCSVKQNKTI